MKGRRALKLIPALIALLLVFVSASVPVIGEEREQVVVLYSLSVDQNDILELSVYNPNGFDVCTSYSFWPGPGVGAGDVLRIVGRDGREWTYIGFEADTVGTAQNLHIAPHSEAVAHVTIRKNYKPAGTDTTVGKVYFGSKFVRC